ncbi:MAG: DUF4339 domain-containing protein [Planctomycetes bacterium]|nr:DUF4339 domain-containing protein [Planctomycetota bacterium]
MALFCPKCKTELLIEPLAPRGEGEYVYCTGCGAKVLSRAARQAAALPPLPHAPQRREHSTNQGDWYITRKGQVAGPYTSAKLKAMAETGRLTADTPVRKGTDGPWTPAREIEGLTVPPQPAGSSAPIEEVREIPVLAAVPIIEWYYRDKTAGEIGPLQGKALGRLVALNEIAPDTLVRKGSDGKWRPAHMVKGLLPVAVPSSPAKQVFSIMGQTESNSRLIVFGGGALLLLLLVIIIDSLTDPVPPAPKTTPKRSLPRADSTPEPKAWYSGGTLHSAKMSEWSRAPYADRLATSADFVAKSMQIEGKTIPPVDQIRPLAEQLERNISAANEGGYADNQKVSTIATMILINQ